MPERQLVPQKNPLRPIKGAWRAFRPGPRNCIGQDLAMLVMKIVLCLTSGEFVMDDCYEKLDLMHRGTCKETVEGEEV